MYFSLLSNTHYTYFCIIKHKYLFPVVIKSYSGLLAGSISSDFPYIAKTKPVVLDTLSGSELHDWRRHKVIVIMLRPDYLGRFSEWRHSGTAGYLMLRPGCHCRV